MNPVNCMFPLALSWVFLGHGRDQAADEPPVHTQQLICVVSEIQHHCILVLSKQILTDLFCGRNISSTVSDGLSLWLSPITSGCLWHNDLEIAETCVILVDL